MRWLTQHKWLTERKGADEGLMAITVTVLAVFMLAMVAFSVDIGSAVAITRSAQNSADAAALSVATDCARTGNPSSVAPYLTNGQVPDAMTPACNSGGTGAVTVEVSRTKDWTFGKLVGLTTYTKSRAATATWGALGSSAGVFPITISTCAFTTAFDTKVTLHSHDTATCSNPAGQFGFIEDGCVNQTIAAGQYLPGTTGNNLNGTGCSEADLNAMLNTDVLVPVWDSATGQGSSAQYHILAYAVFHLTGWSSNGNNAGGTLAKHCNDAADGGSTPKDTKPCIRGVFKGFTTQTGTVVPGLGCRDNILACIVYLDH